MRRKLLQECKTIQDYCKYNAEAHHIIAAKNEKLSIWFQLIPAVIAALSGFQSTGLIIPQWTSPVWGWLAATAAIVIAVSTVLNPLKAYFDHLNAAKSFVVLKHDARALCDTFSTDMNNETLKQAIKNLHERYNDLVKSAPPTTKEAFEEARKRINDGRHEPD
ncbi:MAG: SLATT domain-containing protein [Actinobacteria bacterium]|nr:SLATT domain-containing protein [Actinomycetota bacterium]